jgi:hypothetical protein
MLLDGRAQVSGIKRQARDVTLLIVFNAHHDVIKFKLPRTAESSGWSRLIDTKDPELPARHFRLGAVYDVTGRSLLPLERVPVKKRPRALATWLAEFVTQTSASRMASARAILELARAMRCR